MSQSFRNIPNLQQGNHLKSPAVSENVFPPVHELVQSTQLGNWKMTVMCWLQTTQMFHVLETVLRGVPGCDAKW